MSLLFTFSFFGFTVIHWFYHCLTGGFAF
uniref:Uncharacterized protein n=1 Tax=Anguilla anguilla TaxID=7936 RepID=A0A0E9V825_ANGAN